MGPGDLDDILSGLALPGSPDLLVGPSTMDDAGIYRIDDERGLVVTVDFFTPLTDDPWTYGRVAAANALSDVWAMGGRPLTALNIVTFPACSPERHVLRLILEGAASACLEADCAVAGGHTVDDPGVKFGLAVTGVVRLDRVWANAGARAGDALVLTKPLGTGIVITAVQADMAEPGHDLIVEDSMGRLNRRAAEAAADLPVHGATDVTGFGLVGHACEMARASGVTVELRCGALPLLPGVLAYADQGLVPAGAYRNEEAYRPHVRLAPGVTPAWRSVVHDAQTSGGLLLSLPPEAADELVRRLPGTAWRVGRVLPGEDVAVSVLP